MKCYKKNCRSKIWLKLHGKNKNGGKRGTKKNATSITPKLRHDLAT
jgi:hypothetical protein